MPMVQVVVGGSSGPRIHFLMGDALPGAVSMRRPRAKHSPPGTQTRMGPGRTGNAIACG